MHKGQGRTGCALFVSCIGVQKKAVKFMRIESLLQMAFVSKSFWTSICFISLLSKTFMYFENSFEIKLESQKKFGSEKQPASS
jgi:hypothetical protein